MKQRPRHRLDISQSIQYQDEMNNDYRAVYDAHQLGQLPELSWKQLGARGGLAVAALALTVGLLSLPNQSLEQDEQLPLPGIDTHSSQH